MSNNARPKTAGDELSAAEINQDLPVQGVGGETINGATLPVASFVLPADGELYACDADDTTKLNFDGFVVSNTTNGNAATLQKDGVVSGFSGLTIGAKYYIQNNKTIGVNPGDNEVLVGKAISVTEILIMKQDKIFVSEGESIVRTLSVTDLDDAIIITTGFKPRYFEAIIQLDISFYKDWSSGDRAGLGVKSVLIKGIISGTSVFFYTDYVVSTEPNTVTERNPYFDLDSQGVSAGANHVKPSHDNGETSALNIDGETSDGHKIRLVSVTTDGNDIKFNFTSTQSGASCALRYGVKHLSVFE